MIAHRDLIFNPHIYLAPVSFIVI